MQKDVTQPSQGAILTGAALDMLLAKMALFLLTAGVTALLFRCCVKLF